MNNTALLLLEQSIAHWWRLAHNAASESEGPYANDCALCSHFNAGEIHCRIGRARCPVYIHTGHPGCRLTPYYNALAEYLDRTTSSTAAQLKEFKFLVSLLPKGKSWIAPDGWEWYSVDGPQ